MSNHTTGPRARQPRFNVDGLPIGFGAVSF